MYHHQKPEKNRTLGAWSHNPYKKKIAHMAQDPDIRATAIADKYIDLITKSFIDDYALMPITGDEINFVSTGIPAEKIIAYINQHTDEARRAFFKNRPEKYEDQSPAILAQLKTIPPFISALQGKIRGSQSRNYSLGTIGKEYTELYDEYALCAEKLTSDGSPNLPAAYDFLKRSKIITRWLDKADGFPQLVNPEFQALAMRYCHQLIDHHVIAPHTGAYSRVYMDKSSSEEWADTAEITTPPRAPSVTVAQVNFIKRLLMEATYRFHGNPDISPLARRMHEELGDFDVSFICPVDYYNLAEQISISLHRLDPKALGDERHVLDPKRFYDRNLMTKRYYNYPFGDDLRMLLMSDRLLAVGNSFAYDRLKGPDVRVDREGRIGGRAEVCRFLDATSNPSLGMLAVLANTHFLACQKEKDGGLKRLKAEELLVAPPPLTPQQGLQAFKKSATLKVMRELGIKDAEKRGLSHAQAVEETTAEIDEFLACLHKRQQLLLKMPWGGKARWQDLAAKRGQDDVCERIEDWGEISEIERVFQLREMPMGRGR